MPNRREDYEEEEEESEMREERRANSKRGSSNSDEIEIQKRRGRGSNSKKRKLKSVAEEEEEEEGGGGRPFKSMFVDDEAIEDEDEDEEEDDEGELDGFIVNEPEFDNEPDEVDHDGGGGRRMGFVLPEEEEEEDIDEFERRVQDRFRDVHVEEYEDDTEVGQQALIPGVKDPKLWLVKCAIGKEREVAACLMHKCIDNPGELQIMSAIALDHLKSFIYVEAYKEAHVREACKGLRYVILQKIMLVPIKEMIDVLSCESKSVVNDKWVRIKTGVYKGDLAKIVGHVPGRQQVRVKLIPRVDLQALAKGVESSKKKESGARPDRVPALLRNMNLVRQLGVRVQSMRDPLARGYIEKIDGLSGMIFKDGFHLKVVSDKSIKEAKPSLQELEEFQELDGDGDHTIPNRKKGQSFMKGDAVIVTEGDLRNLVGRVEKVELGTVHIKAEMDGLPETVAINQTALQKCFKEGQHVKVVSGSQQGATGMVVKVDQQKQLITILSDAANEAICVFSDHVVESPEVNNGDTMCDSHNLRYHKTPGRSPRFSGGARRHDGQDGFGKGSRVKFRLGPYKGCRGRVVEVKGSNVRVELESQMKTIVVDRLHCISESGNVAAAVTTPYRSGCETPMPYMRTPMRDPGATSMPYMTTPMRDPGASPMRYMTTPYMMTPRRDPPRATPIHGGMRTPPMTPMRDPRATPIHGGMRTPPIY
ncbi:putative transcription elongation factor SPT5 homolog 1 [Rosa rugosa]|uniref:putative transcription elongation factor SPT5 homolog 1 n=1 Tax=Rosa rugosa TaxID=74645 RepID=UPI002B4083B8|nr:putative transcription elongation factor SPT5 homolog 1 [Rosa rugosa]XP_062000651.1 putative transcription elongation factor SPT5 homolog 1 [Rosa rugosa]